MKKLIQKIIDNRHDIVGIRVNGTFYDVDYIAVEDTDVTSDEVVVKAHQIEEDDIVLDFEFTAGTLFVSDVKLYKLQEIK